MKNGAILVLTIALSVLLSSCPAPTGAASSGDGATSGNYCNEVGFTSAAEDAISFVGGFFYIAQSSVSEPVDTLTIDFVDYTPVAGSIELTDAGTSTCTTCVRIDVGCNGSLTDCTRTLLAQAGTVTVTSVGPAGDTFAGTIENAQFIEVTVDTNDVSTPVAGGEDLCLESYSFSATIQ